MTPDAPTPSPPPDLPAAPQRRRAPSRGKKLLLSLVSALLLLGALEGLVRWAKLDRPSYRSLPLPEEYDGLMRADPELFWSLRPNLDITYEGRPVRTNGLGLRSPGIVDKQPDELRILSLGESTTFGAGVGDGQTYTALLPLLLAPRLEGRPVTAINAGVSAWSSFQSLKFLELRGLALEPDVVLFYHEINDYLPTTLRDSSNTEIGVLQTDLQRYASRRQGLRQWLMQHSALFRVIRYRLATRRLRSFEAGDFRSPLEEVGLPAIGLRPRLYAMVGDDAAPAELEEVALGRRVAPEERRQILAALRELCADKGIRLVILHPSYRESTPHECLLTRFCAENDVELLETHDLLHPPAKPDADLFVDAFHPGDVGHRRLAVGIADLLRPRNP